MLPPYEVSRSRFVLSDSNIPQGVLALYFHGPDFNEQNFYGDIAIYDGFKGFSKYEFADGVARVYLTGRCERAQDHFTVAQLLFANLKQFPEIAAVKIYDENGQTEDPDSSADSLPACLDPQSISTPSATPTAPAILPVATFTPEGSVFPPATTPALVITPGPSSTTRPGATSTRWPTLTPRPTDTRWPTKTSRP